jgi:hypothetical protein
MLHFLTIVSLDVAFYHQSLHHKNNLYIVEAQYQDYFYEYLI